MTTTSKYYEKVLEQIDFFLRNSRNNPYITRYCITEGTNKHTYKIECEGNASYTVQKNNSLIQANFLKDLKECLVNDKPFQLEFSQDEKLIEHFFEKTVEYFYLINEATHYTQSPRYITPTVDEFSQLVKCFEPTLVSLDKIIEGMPRSYEKYNSSYTSFVPVIMSLHNESFYKNKSSAQLKHIIKNELEALTKPFGEETDPFIAEGIQKYLNKKKKILTQINDKSFEDKLYEIIQSLVHSDFWAETSSCLPSFSSKKKQKTKQSIFANNGNPIFHLNLNKENILDISPSIVSDKDFDKMLAEINLAIDKNKPSSIDFVQTINTGNSFKLIMAGQDMNNSLVLEIGDLFQSMINEYNSPNVSKHRSEDETADDKANNHKYLSKAAEILWLNIELKEKNVQKTHKTNKI